MAPIFKMDDQSGPHLRPEAEIHVPTAGTWVGLGAGILVVIAGFVWTIL